ncbi:uncharacterized protein LOC103932148 [Pyrus x bretschneideri]|uniref:uncharacterized protein LOC103932148 n=1 Tax=Pyrus x bretschneideri TaxID=225117 RepID=UPI0005108653|nr:uncharacterized protein LOC103932148 [Pyrus x bretschneideri]
MECLSSNDKDGISDLSKVILNCWQIWIERNNLVFRSVPLVLARCVSISRSVGLAFLKANGKCDPNEALPISSFIKWHPLDRHDVIKLNFDGSVSNSRAAAAFVLRNSNSQVIGEGALNLDGVTISVAEEMCLREWLQCGRHKGFTKVMVEGDSKLIIEAVQGHWGIPWRVNSIINDISILAQSVS